MTHQAHIGARLGISGAFECRDADGNVLKVIQFTGSVPLEDIGLSVEQAQQLIEEENGPDSAP